jgi:hypothetical protein
MIGAKPFDIPKREVWDSVHHRISLPIGHFSMVEAEHWEPYELRGSDVAPVV